MLVYGTRAGVLWAYNILLLYMVTNNILFKVRTIVLTRSLLTVVNTFVSISIQVFIVECIRIT